MYGAKKMAEIQSGLKPTSASDKREGPSASDKRTRKRLVVFDISRW